MKLDCKLGWVEVGVAVYGMESESRSPMDDEWVGKGENVGIVHVGLSVHTCTDRP